MLPARELAVRRMTLLWAASIGWKLATFAVFVVVAARLLGGQGP